MAQEIDALLQENREFPPSDDFRAKANINDPEFADRASALLLEMLGHGAPSPGADGPG